MMSMRISDAVHMQLTLLLDEDFGGQVLAPDLLLVNQIRDAVEQLLSLPVVAQRDVASGRNEVIRAVAPA